MVESDCSTTVTILDRPYSIKCPPEEVHKLQEAALFLDTEMRKFRVNGQVSNTDSVAVVASLNLCHQLLEMKKQQQGYIDFMDDRIQTLHKKIEDVLE